MAGAIGERSVFRKFLKFVPLLTRGARILRRGWRVKFFRQMKGQAIHDLATTGSSLVRRGGDLLPMLYHPHGCGFQQLLACGEWACAGRGSFRVSAFF